MRTLVFIVGTIAVLAPSSELSAQVQRETIAESREGGGFAQTVTRLLANMQGKWSIKSASLRGADLPLDQFDSLTVDNSGIILNVQKHERRFEFKEFRLDSKTFLATYSSPDYPNGLVYELSVSDGLIKIRYRADGAHRAPERSIDDRQLLVQTWKRSPTKRAEPNANTSRVDKKRSPHATQERKQSPTQIVEIFYCHLSTGETRKAKEMLFMPINDQRVAAQIDDILQFIAKQHMDNGQVHVFDSHTIKDMAIVVYGTEGKRYIDNIDIDPIVLRKQSGEWKIVFANSASDLKEDELPDDVLRKRADELLAWYKKREAEVRIDWRKRTEK